jgi:hypothetical protein
MADNNTQRDDAQALTEVANDAASGTNFGQGTGAVMGDNGYSNAAGAATDVSGGISGGTTDGTVTGADSTSGDMTGFGTSGGGSAGSADVPAAPNPDAMPE